MVRSTEMARSSAIEVLPECERQAFAALDARDRDRALTILMSMYGKEMYRYCSHVLGDTETARDTLQVVFVNAYEKLSGFEGRSSLRTWLFRIAYCRCIDALRAKKRSERCLQAVKDSSPPDEEDPLMDEQLHRRRVLKKCLQELDTDVRMAVLLRHQQGMSFPQIAEIAMENPRTLERRVQRALDTIRTRMLAKGFAL
jgi:RNA polymerase sigma-70 factor (ECF subfamily)